MKFPTLFINDNERLRFWSIRTTELPMTDNTITTKWGLYSGIHSESTTTAKPKNLGKINATNSYEQAQLEAKSLWNKKKDEGYKSYKDLGIKSCDENYIHNNKFISHDNLPDHILSLLPKHKVDTNNIPKAMLLHKPRIPNMDKTSKEHKTAKDVHFPCYVQPKKDGVCTIYTPNFGLSTRGGKDRHTPKGESLNDIVPHIKEALDILSSEYTLNAEIYLDGHTLQQISSATKKRNELSKCLEFHIFDVIAPNKVWENRLEILLQLKDKITSLNLNHIIKIVDTHYCNSWDELFKNESFYLKKKEEGIVIRHPFGKYTIGKRSKDVLKLVHMNSSEVEIIDIIPMDKEPTHGMFVCRIGWFAGKQCYTKSNANGIKTIDFKVTPSEFSHDDRIDLLSNKYNYIGKMLTIVHRGYTDSGVPRIAKGKAIRDYA